MNNKKNPKKNKTHWYDGKFYDRFIAPNQDRIFNTIKKEIEPGKSILDIGCGTGRFASIFKDHASYLKGIDLSEKNVQVAKQNFAGSTNLKFEHASATDFFDGVFYDYAVTTYVIHEMNPEDRIKVFENFKNKVGRIIVGEYIVPHPKSFWGIINIIVEFLAGPDHYGNFKHFVKIGGVKAIAAETGYEVEKEILNSPKTSAVYILKPKSND